MSANLLIDLGNTGHFNPSLIAVNGPQSGTVIGLPIDLGDANTFTNVWVVANVASGPITLQVQCSDSPSGFIPWGGGVPPSGTFTDPTSGAAQLPTNFNSGGLLIINSGTYAIPGGGAPFSGQPGVPGGYVAGYAPASYPFGATPVINGMGGTAFLFSGLFPEFASGGIGFGGFQRTGQYARLNLLVGSGGGSTSGGQVVVIGGFLSQKRTTGSGGGFTWLPQSGPNVANV
jgi:hypothetical protein